MADIDSVTSLPLSQSLLSFYRAKLREAHKSDAAISSILDRLQPELEHVHELEGSLASSIQTIDAFEQENADMKALLAELIQENANLRLGKNITRDERLEAQLLQTLQDRPPMENHASVIAMLVSRCESLESVIADAATEMSRQCRANESCLVSKHELKEQLQQCQEALSAQTRKIDEMPTVQDFEFMRLEIRNLHDERLRERQELKRLEAENESLKHHCPTWSNRYETDCGNHDVVENKLGARSVEQDIEKVAAKLKSLEKFALKYMPAENVRGVPEFFQTVDKTKMRIADIDERLHRRMQQRAQRVAEPN